MVNFGSWSSPRRISTALLSWLRSTVAARECASAETVAKILSASWVGNCQKGQPLDRKLDQHTDKEAIKTRGIVKRIRRTATDSKQTLPTLKRRLQSWTAELTGKIIRAIRRAQSAMTVEPEG